MIRAKGKRKTRTCKGRQVAGLNRVIRIGLHKARDSNCTYWCNIQWLMQMKSQRLFTITPLSKQDQDPKLWGSHTSPLPFASMAQLQLFWLGIHALLFQFGLLNLQGEKKHISIKPWCKKSLMLPPFLLPSSKFCHALSSPALHCLPGSLWHLQRPAPSALFYFPPPEDLARRLPSHLTD